MYTTEERDAAYNKIDNYWWMFGALTAALLICCLCVFIFRYSIGYGLALFINIALTSLYGGFMLFFFSIKYKLTKCFVRMLRGITEGPFEERSGIFKGFEEGEAVKDGVYCYYMLTTEYYDKRGIPSERKIHIEATRPKPPLEEGTAIHYLTHANFLARYDIVKPQKNTTKTGG